MSDELMIKPFLKMIKHSKNKNSYNLVWKQFAIKSKQLPRSLQK